MIRKCTGRKLLFVIFLAMPLETGCQNKIRVRVEKVRGVSSVSRDSRVGHRLEEAIESLTRLREQCRLLEKSLDEYVDAFPTDQREAELSFTSGIRTVIRNTLTTADKLIEQCDSMFNVPGLGSPDAPFVAPRKTLREVQEFLEKTARNKQQWTDTLSEFQDLKKLSKRIAELLEKDATLEWETTTPRGMTMETLEEMVAAGSNFEAASAEFFAAAEEGAKATKIGFGGFMTTDVFVINPSDPKYADVLNSAVPVWSVLRAPFYQKTSLEPMTEACVGVSGDSAIMLVMESPGQVRVYQVSLDPTQITRNIGLLVSKATGAAAKYAAGGL